jgi:crotonobetaine/carnitine-CoA ligase
MIDLVGSRTLGDLLDEAVADCGDKTWLTFESREGEVSELSYREFQRQVDQLASGLQAAGVRREHIVLLHMHNHPRFLVAWFALAVLGVVCVPVNVDNTVSEVEHIVDLTQAALVIADPVHALKYLQLRATYPCLQSIVSTAEVDVPDRVITLRSMIDGGSGVRPKADVSSDDVLQMLFTSGTTARPKAAELTHANVLHAGERVVKGLALQSEDRCLTALPLFHVNAQVMAVLASMTSRGSCVLLEGFSARNYWAQVRRHGATCTSLVAMQVRTILAQPADARDKEHLVRRLSFFINVTDEEKQAFESRFNVRFINGYGLTEAMGIVAFTPVFGEQRWPAIGLPAADRTVRLVDDDGHDVAAGEVGEIIVSGTPGRTVMRGYFKDPAATAKTLKDGWLYTGDKARTDAKGYLHFVDRRANLIKRAGENVSATEVEIALLGHPAVLEVAVIGVPDAIRDERIKAVVALNEGYEWDTAELTRFCSTRLAAFKIPTDWERIDRLPRTPIKGDVDKKALRQSGSPTTEAGSGA